MITLISFPLNSFNHFSSCLPDILEEEISRTSIRLKLQINIRTDVERELYQNELDRLTVLRSISQLRNGKLSKEEFNQKIQLTAL